MGQDLWHFEPHYRWQAQQSPHRVLVRLTSVDMGPLNPQRNPSHDGERICRSVAGSEIAARYPCTRQGLRRRRVVDFLEADKFVLFILFVVPGFVCLKTYQVITPGRHRDAAQQLVDAVAYSCVNYALLAFPIFWVEQSGLRADEPTAYFAFWVFAILVAPVIWAWLYRYLRRRRFLQRVLPHPTEAAWDFVFERKQPWWVIATLTDGRRIAGRYDGDSFSSSAPCPEQIYLEECWQLSEDGGFERPHHDTAGVLILQASISTLEFFHITQGNRDEQPEQTCTTVGPAGLPAHPLPSSQ